METWVIILIIVIVIAAIAILVWWFWPESTCEENESEGIKWPETEYDKTATGCKDKKKYTRVCTSNGWGVVTSTSSACESFTNFDEIVVPVYSTNPQYGNPMIIGTETDNGTVMNIYNTYPYRGQAELENYPANPDLYPENGVEFRPENSMYTHLENNFLDIGPQIGVGTRVNSQRNGPQLLFRKDFAVPTMPTGYWNQSTISQPIFTNNVC